MATVRIASNVQQLWQVDVAYPHSEDLEKTSRELQSCSTGNYNKSALYRELPPISPHLGSGTCYPRHLDSSTFYPRHLGVTPIVHNAPTTSNCPTIMQNPCIVVCFEIRPPLYCMWPLRIQSPRSEATPLSGHCIPTYLPTYPPPTDPPMPRPHT